MSKKLKLFNPLDKLNLGESIEKALLQLEAVPLRTDMEPFYGAGIYAIYYAGNFEPYAPTRVKNLKDPNARPIYVGKAIPKGARKGVKILVDPEEDDITLTDPYSTSLVDRLRHHASSVQQGEFIELEDFYCRYLPLDDVWIPLGEAILIDRFKPIWNLYIEGFGNNDPGGRRSSQLRSAWDTVHPGRRWAEKLGPYSRTRDEILEDLAIQLKGGTPPKRSKGTKKAGAVPPPLPLEDDNEE